MTESVSTFGADCLCVVAVEFAFLAGFALSRVFVRARFAGQACIAVGAVLIPIFINVWIITKINVKIFNIVVEFETRLASCTHRRGAS